MSALRLVALAAALCLTGAHAAASPADDCAACHRAASPDGVRAWEGSAHAAAGVGCADCHGTDHERSKQGLAPVGAAVCGRCHAEAARTHGASRHGVALHTGGGCTRALPGRNQAECRGCHVEGSTEPVASVQCARALRQSPEMVANGCVRCHRVETACDACHTSHATDLALARDPGTCARCHMGPDHPQWEIWTTSQHGTLAAMGSPAGPTCQRCHMDGGSHDVSRGVTRTPAGGALPQAVATERRAHMLTVCDDCHGASFARRELQRDDAIAEQALALTGEAKRIVEDLHAKGLLDPMPADRPPHPVRGHALVLDGEMLYEDISHVERLLFRMKKFHLAKTIKGAYHQNPAFTHWHGNAEMKMDLVDIRSEASRLGGSATPAPIPASPAAEAEEALRQLKERHARGELDDAQWQQERAAVLRALREP